MHYNKWIKYSEQAPPQPVNKFGGDSYLATVINSQVVAVRYVNRTIRGKEIVRWEWDGRICPWEVIAYMPYPEPYKEE
jgi:hypothetical protein